MLRWWNVIFSWWDLGQNFKIRFRHILLIYWYNDRHITVIMRFYGELQKIPKNSLTRWTKNLHIVIGCVGAVSQTWSPHITSNYIGHIYVCMLVPVHYERVLDCLNRIRILVGGNLFHFELLWYFRHFTLRCSGEFHWYCLNTRPFGNDLALRFFIPRSKR